VTKFARLSWALVASAIALGCGGSTSDSASNDDAAIGGADVVATNDGAASTYPSGPYGTNEGDVLSDLSWVGYLDDDATMPALQAPFGDTSMHQIRDEGRSYALVHISEFF
jgi:hypothetical protein